MKIFYSKKVELADGAELIIPINKAQIGDVNTSELWVNKISGSYEVAFITREGEDFVDITKGVDFGGFSIADTGEEDRMMYIISDASLVKITATSDSELDVKICY